MITIPLLMFQNQGGKFDYVDPAIPVTFLKNSNTMTFARRAPVVEDTMLGF